MHIPCPAPIPTLKIKNNIYMHIYLKLDVVAYAYNPSMGKEKETGESLGLLGQPTKVN